MSTLVYLTAALQEKLNKAKDSVDIQMACQDPLKFNLLCGLMEFIARRLEGPGIEVVGFSMAAYIAIDDIWTGNYFIESDQDVLRAYPMLLTIDKDDYEFLNESVRCLAKFVFNLPSFGPKKTEMRSFPQKYLDMMEKMHPE